MPDEVRPAYSLPACCCTSLLFCTMSESTNIQEMYNALQLTGGTWPVHTRSFMDDDVCGTGSSAARAGSLSPVAHPVVDCPAACRHHYCGMPQAQYANSGAGNHEAAVLRGAERERQVGDRSAIPQTDQLLSLRLSTCRMRWLAYRFSAYNGGGSVCCSRISGS